MEYYYQLVSFFIGGIDTNKAIKTLKPIIDGLVTKHSIPLPRIGRYYAIGVNYNAIKNQDGRSEGPNFNQAIIVVAIYSEELTNLIFPLPSANTDICDTEEYKKYKCSECNYAVENCHMLLGMKPFGSEGWSTATRNLMEFESMFGKVNTDPPLAFATSEYVDGASWADVVDDVKYCNCPLTSYMTSKLPESLSPPLLVDFAGLTNDEIKTFDDKDYVHKLRYLESAATECHYYTAPARKRTVYSLSDKMDQNSFRIKVYNKLTSNQIYDSYKVYATDKFTLTADKDTYIATYKNKIDTVIAFSAGATNTKTGSLPTDFTLAKNFASAKNTKAATATSRSKK